MRERSRRRRKEKRREEEEEEEEEEGEGEERWIRMGGGEMGEGVDTVFTLLSATPE